MGNLHITAPGYGTRSVSVPTVDQGISIVDRGESKTRHSRFRYFQVVASSSFEFTAVFSTYASYLDFARWVEGYLRSISRADVGFIPPMKFRLPARDFEKQGFITNASFGDDVSDIAYQVTFRVKGASDPLSYTSDLLSKFVQPQQDIGHGLYHYPATAGLGPTTKSREEQVEEAQDLLPTLSRRQVEALIGTVG